MNNQVRRYTGQGLRWCRASVPVGFGCITLPGMFPNLEALQTPCYWDCYGDFITQAWVINFISALLPSQETWGRGPEIPSLYHNLFLLMTSPHPGVTQKSTQGCLIRIKDPPVTQEITRNLGALCRNQSQRPNIRNKVLLVLLLIRKLQGFQMVYARNQRRDQ